MQIAIIVTIILVFLLVIKYIINNYYVEKFAVVSEEEQQKKCAEYLDILAKDENIKKQVENYLLNKNMFQEDTQIPIDIRNKFKGIFEKANKLNLDITKKLFNCSISLI